MNTKLVSYLTADKQDIEITYLRESSSSLHDQQASSVSSRLGMSIDEYSLRRKKRNKTNKKSKSRNEEPEIMKSAKTGSSYSGRCCKSFCGQSSSISVTESQQTTPPRIQTTATILPGGKSMGSILGDIRFLREQADLDREEVDELKDLWQDDISRLLRKWEDQDKKRLIRKQSLILPKRSRQQVQSDSVDMIK
jgi:hypothetical protein